MARDLWVVPSKTGMSGRLCQTNPLPGDIYISIFFGGVWHEDSPVQTVVPSKLYGIQLE